MTTSQNETAFHSRTTRRRNSFAKKKQINIINIRKTRKKQQYISEIGLLQPGLRRAFSDNTHDRSGRNVKGTKLVKELLLCPSTGSRGASMDRRTRELKTTADFVSSINGEHVKVLEIAKTPLEVSTFFVQSLSRIHATCTYNNFEKPYCRSGHKAKRVSLVISSSTI